MVIHVLLVLGASHDINYALYEIQTDIFERAFGKVFIGAEKTVWKKKTNLECPNTY